MAEGVRGAGSTSILVMTMLRLLEIGPQISRSEPCAKVLIGVVASGVGLPTMMIVTVGVATSPKSASRPSSAELFMLKACPSKCTVGPEDEVAKLVVWFDRLDLPSAQCVVSPNDGGSLHEGVHGNAD
jgi:hypothetical protein